MKTKELKKGSIGIDVEYCHNKGCELIKYIEAITKIGIIRRKLND